MPKPDVHLWMFGIVSVVSFIFLLWMHSELSITGFASQELKWNYVDSQTPTVQQPRFGVRLGMPGQSGTGYTGTGTETGSGTGTSTGTIYGGTGTGSGTGTTYGGTGSGSGTGTGTTYGGTGTGTGSGTGTGTGSGMQTGGMIPSDAQPTKRAVPEAKECISDSDGNNPFITGTVKYVPVAGPMSDISISDMCKDQFTLNELYCEGKQVMIESIKCDNGCQDKGFCLAPNLKIKNAGFKVDQMEKKIYDDAVNRGKAQLGGLAVKSVQFTAQNGQEYVQINSWGGRIDLIEIKKPDMYSIGVNTEIDAYVEVENKGNFKATPSSTYLSVEKQISKTEAVDFASYKLKTEDIEKGKSTIITKTLKFSEHGIYCLHEATADDEKFIKESDETDNNFESTPDRKTCIKVMPNIADIRFDTEECTGDWEKEFTDYGRGLNFCVRRSTTEPAITNIQLGRYTFIKDVSACDSQNGQKLKNKWRMDSFGNDVYFDFCFAKEVNQPKILDLAVMDYRDSCPPAYKLFSDYAWTTIRDNLCVLSE